MTLQNGTLVEYWSGGSHYTGFVVGVCSYDNAGDPNGYVVRYVFLGTDAPRHPFGIAAMNSVEPLSEFPEDFHIGGSWSATPDDRCEEWELSRNEATKHLLVIPKVNKETS